MVQSPQESARTSTTEASSEVLATGKEAETWWDLTALDRHHSHRPVQDPQLGLACEGQGPVAINYSPASFAGQLHNNRQLNAKDLAQCPTMDKEFSGGGGGVHGWKCELLQFFDFMLYVHCYGLAVALWQYV